ncbi:hypothetical protein GGI25_001725 [Coemansia spiralis]|uniref:DUF7719 domain-containing protein n=2 Tax=Coemansia TaxID=4863 RepID=A0A9W8G5F8_9FUNG|nr:hypothetical protein BX070DRAFT_221162 [Coemansia spiralis]KAJ1991407.1 hypothetical protein EDC05_003477 [Coemansia umbellata]KAJ2624935.1 hypothetical protein GGI26_001047 [Coemansia sp. RSA 1358]KAJ2679157.1 hypothetical protein GGI25_001725 [Coemansia spiralis]
MATISEDESENRPLIDSLKELTATGTRDSAGEESDSMSPPKLEHPSVSRIVQAGPKLGPDGKPHYLIDDIPDNEKLRLIRESGILKKYSQSSKGQGANASDVEDELDLDELEALQKEYDEQNKEIPTWMDALIYTFGLAAIYGLFEALVSQQYSIEITMKDVFQRMAKAAPAIYFIVYLTSRYRNLRAVKLLTLLAACACGCYFVHLNLHSPRLGIMRRAPGLVTIWMYLIFIMDVRPSIINVAVVGLFWLLDPFKVDI